MLGKIIIALFSIVSFVQLLCFLVAIHSVKDMLKYKHIEEMDYEFIKYVRSGDHLQELINCVVVEHCIVYISLFCSSFLIWTPNAFDNNILYKYLPIFIYSIFVMLIKNVMQSKVTTIGIAFEELDSISTNLIVVLGIFKYDWTFHLFLQALNKYYCLRVQRSHHDIENNNDNNDITNYHKSIWEYITPLWYALTIMTIVFIILVQMNVHSLMPAYGDFWDVLYIDGVLTAIMCIGGIMFPFVCHGEIRKHYQEHGWGYCMCIIRVIVKPCALLHDYCKTQE